MAWMLIKHLASPCALLASQSCTLCFISLIALQQCFNLYFMAFVICPFNKIILCHLVSCYIHDSYVKLRIYTYVWINMPPCHKNWSYPLAVKHVADLQLVVHVCIATHYRGIYSLLTICSIAQIIDL